MNVAVEMDYLQRVYEIIKESRKTYGELKKCEFHIHTPASYDYQLIEGKLYKDLSFEEIIEFAVDMEYLSDELKNEIIKNLGYYQSEKYLEELKEKEIPFEGFKEYLAYMLIAHKLYKETIEVAIISDHNTIKGFKKLRFALEEYYSQRIKGFENRKSIYLFLGVEISCSEQNHLIAIFNDQQYDKIQEFLNEVIISENEGTYYTSQYIIERIENLGGLSYIAHINSSKLYGSQLYNKKLFSTNMKMFGLTNLTVEERERNRIKNYNKDASKKLGVIYEGDSHSVNNLGIKNTWIKFSNIDFAALKKAFQNHQINIYTSKPQKSDRFIKGMVVFPGDDGFLSCNPNKPHKNFFSVDFSRDLNCIIGGRGTGKSTLLNIIETVLTMESDDIKKLEFISKHERIYILFYYKNFDYLIEFVPQKKDVEREYYTDSIFLEKAFSESLSGKFKLSSHWIQLYKVENNMLNKVPTKQSYEILSDVYKRTYSINSIINQVNEGKIGEFIRGVILNGMNYDDILNYLKKLKTIRKNSFNKYLRENIQDMINAVETRRKQIEEHLDEYNKENKDFIEIIYSPRKKDIDYYLKDLLDEISNNDPILNTRLTWNDVARYIQTVSKKIGYMNFLDLLFNNRFKELQEYLNISDMINKRNEKYSDIETEYTIIDSEIAESILLIIFNVLSIDYRTLLIDSIYKWFEIIDDFTLKFNINSKEQSYHSKPVMKEITEMSLGQKVVAILTFVFNYGYYVNDNTPLIIDQPEDNLDNQYIYKNLVESLKRVKNNRQVIIVTHNSTIVTNSDTEQVIVMDSNHTNGWVENKGYPSDKRITKLIINYLEGGIESFKHKMQTYTLFINELNES